MRSGRLAVALAVLLAGLTALSMIRPSPIGATTPATPGAPTGVTASAGNGAAIVGWGVPGDGGSPITSYSVRTYLNGVQQGSPIQVTCTPSPCNPPAATVVTGLLSGSTYSFTVEATNAVGSSPESTASSPVTLTIPTLQPPFHVDAVGCTSPCTPGQIKDSTNAQVIFKGVTWNGSQMVPTGYPAIFPTLDELKQLAGWGGNLIRVALSDDLWNGAQPDQAHPACASETGEYDLAYRTKVDALVQEASSLHIAVVLTLNDTNPTCAYSQGTTTSPAHAGGMPEPLPGPTATQFWTDLVNRYGSNSWVIYEPYNEPHVCATATGIGMPTGNSSCASPGWGSANQPLWANGGTVSDGTIVYTGTGLMELYNVIRGMTNGLVFLDPNSYAGDPLSFDGVNGVNVVYTPHFYPCGQSPSCTGPDPATPNGASLQEQCNYVANDFGWWLRDPNVNPEEHALMWDEFGWPNSNDTTQPNAMENIVSYLNTKGQGWSAFAWNTPLVNYPQNPFAIRQTAVPDPGSADATATGLPIKNAMENVYSASCSEPVVPEAPSGVTAKGAGDGPADPGLTVSWNSPVSAADLTKYVLTIQQSTLGGYGTVYTATIPVSGPSYPLTLGLKWSSPTGASGAHLQLQDTYRVCIEAFDATGGSDLVSGYPLACSSGTSPS